MRRARNSARAGALSVDVATLSFALTPKPLELHLAIAFTVLGIALRTLAVALGGTPGEHSKPTARGENS